MQHPVTPTTGSSRVTGTSRGLCQGDHASVTKQGVEAG